jgi:hypothetical protein
MGYVIDDSSKTKYVMIDGHSHSTGNRVFSRFVKITELKFILISCQSRTIKQSRLNTSSNKFVFLNERKKTIVDLRRIRHFSDCEYGYFKSVVIVKKTKQIVKKDDSRSRVNDHLYLHTYVLTTHALSPKG